MSTAKPPDIDLGQYKFGWHDPANYVFEPKRGLSGSATVRQLGPNVMVVKGCAVAGLICKEQRWTRVDS